MEQSVSFKSDGLDLAGVLHIPQHVSPARPSPAVIVLHGFGSSKDAPNCVIPAQMLCDLGYVALRFDMRGCGASGGNKGHVICLEQVADTRSAITYLSQHPAVAANKIALLGSSFGAAVSIYTAGIDDRVAAVVSSSGWGNGERKFRAQHAEPSAWQRFASMIEEGRWRVDRGERMTVPRFDIVPIPPHMREMIGRNKQAIMDFPVETALSMYDFMPESVIGSIAPRPLLLLHAARDSVTPTRGSIDMFHLAGDPTELHLFTEVDHFLLAEGNERVHHVLRDWLTRYFPANADQQAIGLSGNRAHGDDNRSSLRPGNEGTNLRASS